jgi:glycerate dehydrogenase
MKAVILDYASLAPADLDLSVLRSSIPEWEIYESTEPEQTAERIRDADIVFSNKVFIGAEEMRTASQLKLIAVMATGTNNVDLPAATAKGITVCNAVGYSTPSVVQHTFALLLALVTKLPDYQRDVQAGTWQKSPFFCLLDYPVMELAGKTIGIIGYGTLGKAVADIAKAFGMKVLVAASSSGRIEADRLPLTELLPQVDVLTLHCPLSDQTRNLLNAETMKLMKKGALIVNTARGGIVDDQALADALSSGHLGGAGIDVIAKEPPRDGNPLLAADVPNLILTPHTAWASRESRQRLIDQLHQVVQAFLNGSPINKVNH